MSLMIEKVCDEAIEVLVRDDTLRIRPLQIHTQLIIGERVRPPNYCRVQERAVLAKYIKIGEQYLINSSRIRERQDWRKLSEFGWVHSESLEPNCVGYNDMIQCAEHRSKERAFVLGDGM